MNNQWTSIDENQMKNNGKTNENQWTMNEKQWKPNEQPMKPKEQTNEIQMKTIEKQMENQRKTNEINDLLISLVVHWFPPAPPQKAAPPLKSSTTA